MRRGWSCTNSTIPSAHASGASRRTSPTPVRLLSTSDSALHAGQLCTHASSARVQALHACSRRLACVCAPRAAADATALQTALGLAAPSSTPDEAEAAQAPPAHGQQGGWDHSAGMMGMTPGVCRLHHCPHTEAPTVLSAHGGSSHPHCPPRLQPFSLPMEAPAVLSAHGGSNRSHCTRRLQPPSTRRLRHAPLIIMSLRPPVHRCQGWLE